ncbi:hypothetical protein BJ875DRAFT_508003 [Amylocarpus encephaloides]|uniref:Heterokaryon incompatibility domain-containing protein n=1 Tax=Amylocarpus encephaloides TaxID=45428 RepID=A0A9P7YA72_9HELO|nr:hypothetical protein BJ875DRAFT_508003 [Amylocarpus encephaloides]
MRLLHFNTSGFLTSTYFSGMRIPPYAILSHTWSSSESEFLFEDLVNSIGKKKAGYEKILFCSKQIARDGLQYFWIDTCCIDKWDPKCYVFLTDVSTQMTDPQLHQDTWETSFRESRWFTRGWTLQELIAPASVEFFSLEGQLLVPIEVLQGDPLGIFSFEERKKWMEGRETKEEEDMAYSLIGILQVSMEFIYGEGKERALSRLEEVKKGELFVGTSTRKVAITSRGGIGKTQLELELAYRTRRERKDCLMFWIPANNIDSHHQAYINIARRLNISGWDDEKVDIKKLVRLHLNKESTGQWLLIFDGVEDEILETAGSSKRVSLVEYIPSSKQGAVVFTTTDRDVATALASQNIVELPENEQDLARRMLETCLTIPESEQEESNLLLQELVYLPLAIVQAIVYINVNKITPKAYLLLLAKQKQKHSSSSREEHNHKDIPLSVLQMAPILEGVDPIETLHAYSFITKRQAQSAVELHRLMHLATRQWLQRQNLLTEWTEIAITRLVRDFPDNTHGNISKWRRLLPHAKFVLLLGLMMKCAASLMSEGRYNEAEGYFQEAMETRMRLSGHEHPSMLASMVNLASTYSKQGRWKEAEDLEVKVMETISKGRWMEAEDLEVKVMETRSRVLGQEHPDTLTSMANLAFTWNNNERRLEALGLLKECVQLQTRILGAYHPDTMSSQETLIIWQSGDSRNQLL